MKSGIMRLKLLPRLDIIQTMDQDAKQIYRLVGNLSIKQRMELEITNNEQGGQAQTFTFEEYADLLKRVAAKMREELLAQNPNGPK